jgi:ATP-binding cassette subfamily B (MDR/TAP) protein 6
MLYCPPNVTFTDISFDHGFPDCLIETVTSSVIAVFLLFFGSIQLIAYTKYSNYRGQLPISRLYNFQIFLLLFVPLFSVIRIVIIQLYSKLYGFMVSYIIKI